LQKVKVVPEHSYEDVVPRHLRDIADELGLEEPAWYVGRPPVESLVKNSGDANGNHGAQAATDADGPVSAGHPADPGSPASDEKATEPDAS
jgi:hypothetical protein